MPKLIRCPLCGRKNSIVNSICSNCGANLEIAAMEEDPNYKFKKIKDDDIQKVMKELNIDFQPKETTFLELVKPNETKLFLFINLAFTSLFLHLLVQQKTIFVLAYYPSLYLFCCHWASKQKVEWQGFLFQFVLLMMLFFFLFFIIPNYFISS